MSDQGNYRPLSYFQLMEISLRELLVEKGVLTNEQVDATVEDMRNRTPERGAKVVARAWVDDGFKKRLLKNGTKACEELGLDVPALPLYRVRFRQKDVWPDYAGSREDVLEVEIFQHWLEPV